jgi:hypothetical protein
MSSQFDHWNIPRAGEPKINVEVSIPESIIDQINDAMESLRYIDDINQFVRYALIFALGSMSDEEQGWLE